MTPSNRDRISVDLRGLRAALFEKARSTGVSPSDFVRDAVSRSLNGVDADGVVPVRTAATRPGADRVRLSIRLSRREAALLTEAAEGAGLTVGAFVSGVAAGVPLLTNGGPRSDYLKALVESNAQMATLVRNVHQLTTLLRRADNEAVRSYVVMMKTLDRDVRRHLEASAAVLTELLPAKRNAGSDRVTRIPGRPT